MSAPTLRVEPLDPDSDAGHQAAAHLEEVLADIRVAIAERERQQRKQDDEAA